MAAETELERLVATLVGDASAYLKMLNDAKAGMDKTARGIEGSTSKIEGNTKKMAESVGRMIGDLGTKMSNMAGQMRAMAAIESPFGFMKEGVRLAADAEMMEVQFGTMLKSVDLGTKMVEDLTKFAAETPLNMPGLQATTKTLLQFGVAGDDVIPTIKMLGDAASGEQDKLSRLAIAFGQARSAGRLMGEEVAQMREAGFNPLAEISRTTGKSMAVLTEEMSKGKISVKMMEDAFKSATGAGGMFEDGMKKASKTANGLWSTMMDDIDATKRTVGQLIITQFQLKAVMETVSEAAQSLTKSIKEMSIDNKSLIATTAMWVGGFGVAITTWKVGAIAIGMVVGVLKDMKGTLIWLVRGAASYVTSLSLVTIGTNILTVATRALSFAMKAVPLALVAIGIAELIKHYDGLNDKVQGMNASLEKSRRLTEEIRAFSHLGKGKGIEAALDFKTPEKQAEELQKLIDMAEKNSLGLKSNVATATKEVVSLSGTIQQAKRSSVAEFFGIGDEERASYAIYTGMLQDANLHLQDNQEYLARLREELKKVKETAEIDPSEKGIKELTAKYTMMAATVGKTAEEIEFYKATVLSAAEAETVAGLSAKKLAERQANIAAAHSAMELAMAGKEAAKLTADINSLTESLSQEVEAMGLSSSAAKLLDFRTRGAGEAALAAAEAWAVSSDFLKEHNEAMAQGESITKQFMDPLEEFMQRQKELQYLFDVGAISEEIFGKAMVDAEEKLESMSDRAREAKESIQGLANVLAGSAEAQRRISAYVENLGGGRTPEIRRDGRQMGANPLPIPQGGWALQQPWMPGPGFGLPPGGVPPVPKGGFGMLPPWMPGPGFGTPAGAAIPGAADPAGRKAVIDALTAINTTLGAILAKPGLVVAPAGVP